MVARSEVKDELALRIARLEPSLHYGLKNANTHQSFAAPEICASSRRRSTVFVIRDQHVACDVIHLILRKGTRRKKTRTRDDQIGE